MTPQELKNSILQLAIQGKLVEQRPEEGSAEELFTRIQKEKQRLIAEKKIKKEKLLPETAEDEKPFEIPESWIWVRVGQCFSNKTGLSYKKDVLDIQSDKMIRVLRGGNISDLNYVLKSDDIWISAEFVKNELYLQRNTIITPAVTSLEHIGKMGRIDSSYSDMVVGGFVLMLIPHYSEDTLSKYLLYAMSSRYFRDCCRNIVNKSGQAFYNLSREKLMQLFVPLPPLAEQKRIVAKIEELLPYIDHYEQAWNKLEQFNSRFPEDMRKSLLQYAIQGKLVEQCPEEGTAEELFAQIQQKKQRLIAEKKIKKEKPLPEITEYEKTFDIPESWKWVRLGSLARLENGDRSSKYPVEKDYVDSGIPFFGAKDMGEKFMLFDHVRYISESKFNELGNGKLHDKDFICLLRGSVGKVAIFANDSKHHTGFICAQMVILRCFDLSIVQYLYHFMKSAYYAQIIESKTTGTAVRQLPAKELANVLIPLPPLAEQKRIVKKLEQLLPLCDCLK